VHTRALVCVTGLIVLALPSSVLGQRSEDDRRRSRFGVIVNFALPSDVNDRVTELFEAGSVTIRSRDFEIGLARGSELGGDWGLSYIGKRYRDGSLIDDVVETCFSGGCARVGTRDSFQDVELRGLSVHEFLPFVTIAGRAQIGMTFGGGFGKLRGRAQRQEYDLVFVPPAGVTQTERVTQVDIGEVFLEGVQTIPIWKVEVTGAAIVAPGLKVRVGGGINFLNYPAASAGLSYPFGS
jgi:hypothetical protein